jgi:hypothetical protein
MEYIENIKPIGGVICQTVTKSEKYYKFLGQYLNILFDLDEYLNNSTINQIIAIKSNNLIGARMFRINDGFIHLSYTAVIPEERGKSINHQMLLEIEKIALNRDIDNPRVRLSKRIEKYFQK